MGPYILQRRKLKCRRFEPLSWVELLHKKTLWQGAEDKEFIREVIPGSTGRGGGQGDGGEKKLIQGMLASS